MCTTNNNLERVYKRFEKIGTDDCSSGIFTFPSTCSKIFVIFNTLAYNNNSGKSMGLSIYCDSSDLVNGSWGMINSYVTNSSVHSTIGLPTSFSVLCLIIKFTINI